MTEKRMLDFAAIDFETANGSRASVCSVGVVIVRGGEIVERFYSLIKPTPFYFQRFTTAIHGLTKADVKDAPEFPEVWAQIEPLIQGLPLVAHNSPFDQGCLRAVHEAYQMHYPDYQFYCTCQAARRSLRSELPNHCLETVAAYCGYDLTRHHHALADAEACAVIAMQLL